LVNNILFSTFIKKNLNDYIMLKKQIFFILIISFAFSVKAQLYVSPTSYLFVKNHYVFVKQNVNIKGAGNIYLRNTSQLLQGGTGVGANAGDGNLSIFQEGKANNFQYNYWCSPVGAPLLPAGNNPFGISRLYRPTGLLTSSPATILPISNYNGTSNPLAIAPNWIWKFLDSSTYAGWIFVGSASTINAGEGFSMKGVSGTDSTIADTSEGVANNINGQRYDFRGKPNDGLISVTVSSGNFTLVGNPYPSAIDLNMYLRANTPGPDSLWGTADDVGLNNTSIDGTAYFWEQVNTNSHYLNQYEGGYATYTPGSGYTPADFWSFNGDGTYNVNLVPSGTANLHSRFAPVGQGFMVKGDGAGTVSMKNSYRVFRRETETDATPFARISNVNSSNENNIYYDKIPNVAGTDYTLQKVNSYAPQISLVAFVNNGGYLFNKLGFSNGYSDGFDKGADTPSVNDTNPISFYQILEETDKEFRTSLTYFDIEKGYPIGFRCDSPTNFQVRVSEYLYGFDLSDEVFIHDKITDIYYDIKNGVFEMVLPSGDHKTQFEIKFKNTSGTLTTPDDSSNTFAIFQNNEHELLTILNNFKKDIKSVSLYDISGKLILNKENLGNNISYQFATGTMSDGVYIVKVSTNDNLILSKKLSIHKKQ